LLLICREIFELAARVFVLKQDINSFERYFAQLKVYYFDFGKKYNLPESSRQYCFLGLNLLRLLSKNKLADFHTELELIPIDKHQHDIFVKFPVELEQFMMEGAYNKVLHQQQVPSDMYQVFMSNLIETVLNEVADCVEKSYDHLNVSDAQKLFGFLDENKMKDFGVSRQWKVKHHNGKNFYDFSKEPEKTTAIPSLKLIKQNLYFAKEIERII